jgi:hypothetical protein
MVVLRYAEALAMARVTADENFVHRFDSARRWARPVGVSE